jgi:hypothetical protein
LLVKQNAIQDTEVIFKMSKMISLYCLNLGLQLVKTFFKGTVKNGLLKTILDEIQAVPEKAYGKDYSRHQKKQQRHYRGENFHYFVYDIPRSHFLPLNINIQGLGFLVKGYFLQPQSALKALNDKLYPVSVNPKGLPNLSHQAKEKPVLSPNGSHIPLF